RGRLDRAFASRYTPERRRGLQRQSDRRAHVVLPRRSGQSPADDLETELERFRQKVDAGAKFAMTQALFDLGYLDRFEELLGGWPIPIMVGIFIVRSHQLAVRLHNEVPGIVVPEPVQNRFRAAGARGAEVGLELARELYGEAREKAAGVYVIPPLR